MKLVATATEPRCRLCASPRRAEVDAQIARLGGENEVGDPITWERLLPALALIVGQTVSRTSAVRHRNHHCRRIEDDGEAGDGTVAPEWEGDEETQALLAEIREIAAEDRVSASRLLNLQQRIYLRELGRKIANGESIQVTADQAARAADRLLSHERTNEQAALLAALGGGIAKAFEGRILTIADHDEKPALIEGEVVHEAEVIVGESAAEHGAPGS